MYCKFCGKTIDDDSIYCRYCGSKVISSQEGCQHCISVEISETNLEYRRSLVALIRKSIKDIQSEEEFGEIIRVIYNNLTICITKGLEEYNEMFLEILDGVFNSPMIKLKYKWVEKYAGNRQMLKSIILPSREDIERELKIEQLKSHFAPLQVDSNLIYVENPETKQDVIIKGVDEVGKDVRAVDGKIWVTCKKNGKWGVFFGNGIVIPCIYDEIFLIEHLYGHGGDNACCIECHKNGDCGLLSPVSGTTLAEFGEFKNFDICSNWPEHSGFSIIGTYKVFDEDVGWLERFFPRGKEWFELGNPKWC